MTRLLRYSGNSKQQMLAQNSNTFILRFRCDTPLVYFEGIRKEIMPHRIYIRKLADRYISQFISNCYNLWGETKGGKPVQVIGSIHTVDTTSAGAVAVEAKGGHTANYIGATNEVWS